KRHEDRQAAPEHVPPDEEAHLPIRELQQPRERVPQLLRRGGEKLILRETIEERDERLVVVRALHEVDRVEHLMELAVERRSSAGGLRVSLRGEQAEQPLLAEDLPRARDAPDADVVHARTAVNGGLAIGLRVD